MIALLLMTDAPRPSSSPLSMRAIALWLVGVALIVGRLLLGTLRILTLGRAAERITSPAILALAQRTANRLGVTRPITLDATLEGTATDPYGNERAAFSAAAEPKAAKCGCFLRR